MAMDKRNPGNRKKSIEARKRRQKVQALLLRGHTDQFQLAAAMRVSQPTISQDIAWIEENWLKYDIRKSRLRRSKRVKQLEFAAQEAFVAFERSKKNIEEVTTEYSPKTCPDCKGTGMVEDTDRWCPTCKGETKILSERVTKKIKGTPGDPAFLAIFKACITDAARMEGLYVRGDTKRRQTEKDLALQGPTAAQLLTAPPDVLLRIRQAFLDLNDSVAKVKDTNGNGRIIEGELVPLPNESMDKDESESEESDSDE